MIIKRFAAAIRRQDWFQVVIEVLIVIVGIFLGLQAQEFYERSAERDREQIYLTRIYQDLGSDITALENSLDRQQMFTQMGEFLLQSLENPNLVREQPTYFILAVDMACYSSYPQMASDSYEEINLNTDRSIFRDQELLIELTSYYNETTDNQFTGSLGMNPIQTNYFLLSDGILNFAQMKEINLKGPGGEYSFTETEAVAAYERMLARPDFIDQIPRATNKGFMLRIYGGWLEKAKKLRTKLADTLGMEEGT